MELKGNRDVASHFPQHDDELDWAFFSKNGQRNPC